MSGLGFVQIHFLTPYAPSLLNRDDVGFAKRIPFGSAVRTRISSQCLKRHWRKFDGNHALGGIDGVTLAVRSRQTFDREILRKLVDVHGIPEPLARAVTEELMSVVLGESAKKRAAQEKKKSIDGSADSAPLNSAQVTVLGRPELDFLLAEAREVCRATTNAVKAAGAVKKHLTRERTENLRALKCGSGLDAALFGRMVTGDILARCDGALHVAHAFTVHGEAAESDYFTAVDDLLAESGEGEVGSAHINTSELTSGLFYGYVVADIRRLVANLSNDRVLAAHVMDSMVRLIATVSPGAKLGSTAPYSYAHLMLVEFGKAQPRTLANAFLTPVREAPDL
jgi:CRISPR system Cascade subunit CasC